MKCSLPFDGTNCLYCVSIAALQAGRVNGNLNLSRSIGDLKYKANTSLPPADQMITAEPDIKAIHLEDGDTFIVLACDGVWDCMSSQEVSKDVKL